MQKLVLPSQETLSLSRYPDRKNETLMPFDASDELVLSHFHENESSAQNVLVIEDNFGALSLGLKEITKSIFTDSFVSSKGILENCLSNKISAPKIINDLQNIDKEYDFVVIKLPKNMSYFEDLLITISRVCPIGTKIICAAMIKHLPTSAFTLLEKYIGPVTTSLAKKKARLLFSTIEKVPQELSSPYPIQVQMPGFSEKFSNHSNVFSREKLDQGSRFLLEHIPSRDYKNILDLGCGNGIIGIKAKMKNPDSHIHFADESFMAIKSAKENYQKYFSDEAFFHWTNCFENGEKNFFDLVLCNPPFHQNNTVGDFIAWQMFNDAAKVLKKGGQLRVIGNRHLGYHIKLARLFSKVDMVEGNKKFVIIDAFK
ncbi:ribosomal protein L11 methyltransferase-like protein [Bacteriovorax sp. BSW11_IV]|uniref:methyltransferase n=1 Tax=Bacteriovorax sp. BSW11_IV TaxID=1353529 RepID=UPI00038A012C|nr:methyltransferase [Bacteriovorax sp. BSW11_IV]EQC49113.1 ribosomal protein L11 methyltransferase-like protein [Bacteriovorax sp. BSW11_IV]